MLLNDEMNERESEAVPMAKITAAETIQSVESTNDRLKRLLPVLSDGYLLMAETQTAGKGRNGSVWQSTSGENLTFSFHLVNAGSIEALLQRVACALVKTLAAEDVANAAIKLPNDIWIGPRKIAGILMETRRIDTTQHVVCGIGVNVNTPMREKTDITATSMAEESGRTHDRMAVLMRFVDIFNALATTSWFEEFRRYVFRLKQGALIDGDFHELTQIDKKMVCELKRGSKAVSKPFSHLKFIHNHDNHNNYK